MSMFSLPSRASSNRKRRRATRSSSPARSVMSHVNLNVECLEDRTLMTGTWTTLANLAPSPTGIGTMMLLTDGTVMAQGGNIDSTWYKLMPDSTGSYANGAWSSRTSMSVQRLYYGSSVLTDGRVFVVGGEYSSDGGFSRTGETYNPVTNTWTNTANFPQSSFGDDPTMLLPDGSVLGGYVSGPQTYIYHPTTNTWTQTGTKLRSDQSDEETWIKLPDDSILSYDIFSSISTGVGHAQRYIPTTGTWVDASDGAPSNLSSIAVGYEMGPALLLPDGRVFQLGATGHTAYYTPSTNSWAAGPDIPISGGIQLAAYDNPAAVLPNGKVLLAVGRLPIFGAPTSVFEFDPATNTYTNVTPASSVIDLSGAAYVDRMLVLPTGQLLLTSSNTRLALYTPDGAPDDAWKPTISSVVDNGDGSFTVTGTQVNGISEGASYGDDAQMSSNYPIVRLTDATGNVFYARTYNWSSTGVATGTTPETFQFTPPAGIDAHSFTMTVIANGITSDPRTVIPAGPSVVSQTPTNTFGHVSSIRLTFDESIDVNTFTADKIRSFTDPAGNAIAISDAAITPVAGSNDRQFDISFASQTTLGVYTISVGPDVEDTLGHAMDQNHNGITGEDPGDVYTGHFSINAPKITASSIIQGATFQPGALTSVQLTFNEPIDPATFNPSQVIFINPSGAIYFASSVTPVAGSSNTRFDLRFAANVTGRYTLIVLPTMRDAFGIQLDQNGNFVPGEIPDDEYIQHFNISGPKVTASQNLMLGDPANQIFNRVQVTFDEAMDPSSFTPAQVHLTSPTGAAVPVNTIVPVAGSGNKQFNILFDPQGQIGVYSVAVGPNVRDTFGNPMDQNGNLIPGEDPADRYTTGFTVHGPAVRTDSTFDPDNYTDRQVLNRAFPGVTLSYLGNDTNSVIALPTPAGSAGGARVFGSTDASYGPEFYNSGYELRISFATPVSSVSIDAIGSFNFSTRVRGLLRIFTAAGELPPVTTPDLLAPGQLETMSLSRPNADITSVWASSNDFFVGVLLDRLQFAAGARTGPAPVNSYRVTFDKPMDVSSFTPDKVASFTDPSGNPVAVDGVFPVAGSNFTQFDITFHSQVLAGTYTLVIGPDVRDLWGNAMDQNGNLIAGEVPDDQFTGTFQITGLQLTGSTSGVQSPPVDHVHLTFNEPVDPASFTAEQVVSFTGPDGDIAITGVSAVPFTNNTQFDVFFDPQSALGDYTMVLGGGIHDLYGNALENADPVRFSIRTISVFDPDDYATGQVLNHAFPGVTLSFLGNSTNSVVALPTPPGSAGGARVFGSTTGGSFSPEFYNDPSGSGWWLRINFATPVSSVSIDAIGTTRFSGQARGLLRIYNAANQLLGSVTTADLLAGGQLATLSLSRPSADIAYAFASSDQVNQGVLLDDLSFATTSEPFAATGGGRSYSILGLEPGGTYIRGELQTGWTQTVSAEGFSSINLVSGQNQPGVDIANVEETGPSGIGAQPSPGRAIAAPVSARIRHPFEDSTDSDEWWWI
jgi:hypothetical protein